MSKIITEDFEYITDSLKSLEQLQGKTVFVTGATGFLGSFIIRTLDYANKNMSLNIKILALVRDESKAKNILRECRITVVNGDICEFPVISDDIDYIFHCAAITKSKEMVEKPVQVIEGIVNGTQNILRLAHEKNVKSMVYLSSMEVYGDTNPELEYVKEEDLGFVQIQNARSCYPLGKRMAENICYSYFCQYGVPVKIARLAQTFGTGILKTETRVFYQFALSAIKGENIILHTDGSSSGNYCYSADAVMGLLLLLLDGKDGEIYNIANENANMTIKQMAEMVADKITNGKISVIYDIPKENTFGYAAPAKMKLSSEKIRTLGWQPKYNLEEMYVRMIQDMKE